MDIRNRLTIKFSFIVITLFVLFSICVYFFSSIHRKSVFITRLKNRGITISQRLDNIKDLNLALIKEIDKNTKNALYGETFYIFNNDNKLIYTNDTSSINYPAPNLETLNKIVNIDRIFYLGTNEAVGFVYSGKTVQYKVIISAYDQLGFDGLQSLKIILLIGCILSVACSYILGWIYSGNALKPIDKIITDVDKITATELNLRLDEGKKQDEIERLSMTFNQMLDRLVKAFETQKGFISNASHELRTPLTSMRGHIEVTLVKERNPQEYSEVLHALLSDIDNLNKISNNLLSLALTTTDVGALKLKKVRIDDILFAAREELLSNVDGYSVSIILSFIPEDENQLSILGNEQLIKTAFFNLLENGCKYSDNNKVEVSFNTTANEIELEFKNTGIGVPESEIGQVFQPFYRASNIGNKTGSGLGLALTQKIIELHKGGIELHSVVNKETSVRVVFPTNL
ncbi:MAG TPA: HAMP domain-containing sensor histidine kinase [Bacteroidia bacterium]|nr:HAMP domain-containing sensor histidine kinase [Bacteroidia bacterium]